MEAGVFLRLLLLELFTLSSIKPSRVLQTLQSVLLSFWTCASYASLHVTAPTVGLDSVVW